MLNDNPIDFIKTLKSEHRSIIATMHDIDNQSSGPEDFTNSIEKLNKITDLFFDHLDKEDKYLYPALISSKHTAKTAKKYSYDMERLTCIGLEFFKRYCLNKDGIRIFAEDFVNAYSVFKGLLKLRVKREETELYPLFILLESGSLDSDVLDYVQEQEIKSINIQKQIFVFGQSRSSLEALTLALEIAGHKTVSTHSFSQILSRLESTNSNLILIDATQPNKELKDLLHQLKSQVTPNVQIIGFSNKKAATIHTNIQKEFDGFMTQPALDIEEFASKINKLVNQ